MKRQKPIRVGIIGLGGVGERILQACLEHPLTEIAIICDVAEERVKQASQHNQLPWCTDYKQMLADPNIDLVYVGVPPKYHHTIALDVLRAQKHILCEKPLANSLEEAKIMYEAAEHAGVVHAMHFPTYYRSAFIELSKRVAEGFLGELRRIEVKAHFHKWPREWQQNSWIGGREQGGFIREVLPHYIHLIQTLFGPVYDVRSLVDYPADPELCETGIIASARLHNGVPILFEGVSQIAQKEEILFTLYGSAGTLALQDWGILKAGTVNEAPATVPVDDNNRTLALLNELTRAIQGERADIVDFKQGYEIQQVLELLLQNQRTM